MATLLPFPAVRPPKDVAERVANPPYDVVSGPEAARMTAENPLGFLRVGRAEIELPTEADPYDTKVYELARANYERLKSEAPLIQDDAPHFYVYELEMNGRSQTGIVAAAAVDDYDNDIIKKHEHTREVKENDRTRHILALRSQTGPVFLTYRDSEAVNAAVAEAVKGETIFDFEAQEVRHRGWSVPAALTSAISEAFASVPYLYIADGHHRAASASRVRATLRGQNQSHSGTEEYNSFLTVTFPASQLTILPYNRLVHDLGGLRSEQLLTQIPDSFEVSEAAGAIPEQAGDVHMYLQGQWRRLRYTGSKAEMSPVARLDVSLLQDLVLTPILGIDDPRTSNRIDFVGGIRGTAPLEQAVNDGDAAVAFSMYPTTVEDLMAISDAKAVMPPKSTWFEPKLRDGLFCHDI